ncbi:MAG: hypothetical protein IKI69_06460 [Oscillospiraceae bacterium]|nr:hypothetical protein [Oscillospiraceae bacterium]
MNNNEREIRLSDLGAMILKSFTAIIALTLVFALLGGLYGAYREIRREKRITVSIADVKKAEDEFAAIQKKLSDAQKALRKRTVIEIPDAERNIENAELLVQRRQEYIDNSLYQAMNPLNHAVSRMTIYVKTDVEINPNTPWLGSDPQSSIAIAFTRAYDNDTAILDRICEIMNTTADVRYVKELISVTAVSDQFVEIVVYYDDVAIAEKVLDFLYQELSKRMKENIGDFSANIISQFTGNEVDWKMSDKQNDNQDNLLSAQRALEEANVTLKTLQDGIADIETLIEESTEQAETKAEELEELRQALVGGSINARKVLRKTVIFLVLGAVLGLCGASFLTVFRRLFGGKLQNQNDILVRYDFSVLGVLPGQKRRPLAKTIYAMEGEMDTDYASAMQTTVQSVKAIAGEESVGLISTRGCEPLEEISSIGGKQFVACGNILDDAKAVKAVEDCDKVLLVEKKECSYLSQIDAEVLRARALGKTILGMVIADVYPNSMRKNKKK